MKIIILTVSVLFLCAGTVVAQTPLTVINPGFEEGIDPNGATPDDYRAHPYGWYLTDWEAYTPSGSAGQVYTKWCWDLRTPTGTGNNSATCLKLDLNWNLDPSRPGYWPQGVFQELDVVYEANKEYDFSLMCNKDYMTPGTYMRMQLGYRDNPQEPNDYSSEVVVLTEIWPYPLDSVTVWEPYNVQWTTGFQGNELGKKIVIAILNTDIRSGLTVDDIEVTATDVPRYCGDPLTNYLDEDLNHDCYVNLLDLAVFAGSYLTCTDPADPVNCVP